MGLARRRLLGLGLGGLGGIAGAGLAGCGVEPTWMPAGARQGSSPSPSAPPRRVPRTPDDLVFTPGRALRPADAEVPYREDVVDVLAAYLEPTKANPRHPSFAGAVVLAAVDGQVTVEAAVGDALRYGTGPVELPPSERVEMRTDSIFDTASLTKVFTGLLVLRLADRGKVDLDAPVADYLPGFARGAAGGGKAEVTVAMLLAHTSGLPVGISPGLVGGSPAARSAAILGTPLLDGAEAGTVMRYSGLGFLVLGLLVEQVAGRGFEAELRSSLLKPLGLTDTGFRPLDRLSTKDRAARLVATDARTHRGLLRGVVHDDIANAMGGVAAHAGIFSTAADLAVVCQMLLNGGEYGGARILREETIRRMLVNANAGLPVVDKERPQRTSTHGLGVELNQKWFMGRLAGPLTFGHTGFTGTSMLVDPVRGALLVLLTNRAHPDWTRADPDPVRAAVASAFAVGLG
jgi:CubicO group peptidase (beta-lactamase class C family)